ncbi:MAG: hypothetical protein ACRCV9_04240, partial [Burkholderiaceae bacterium]
MNAAAMHSAAKKPWLHRERVVAMQAWHLTSPLMRWIMGIFALLGCVGTFLGAFVGGDQPLGKSLLWGALVGVSFISITAFFSLPLTVQRLHSVAAVDTVPGHRKALKAVGFATWSALALLICTLVVVFNHFADKTPSASTLFTQLTIGVCAGTWFLTCFPRRALWFVWIIGWIMPSAMKSAIHIAVHSLYVAAGPAALLLFAGALAANAWFFYWAYFAGTPGERAQRAAQVGRYNSTTNTNTGVKPSGSDWLDYIRFRLLGTWNLHLARTWPASARLALGLGPQWNPLYTLGFVPPLAVLLAAMLLWFGGPPLAAIPADQLRPTMTGMLIGALTVSFGNVFMLSLAHTRTEQAVLLLLP